MPEESASSRKRSYISQSDVPRVSLAQALRVPRALAEHYAKQPARPLDIAAALEMSPTSGTFRELCGASLGYGLTEGGPNATTISLTPLGQRIVAPLTEGDDTRALRQAVLTPTVEKGFLAKYDGSPLPAEKIGCNVLETMGVPADATGRVLTLIVENARSVNFLKVIKDKTYVDLEGARTIDSLPAPASGGVGDLAEGATEGSLSFDVDPDTVRPSFSPTPTSSLPKRNRRVFVSHGKSRRVVDQLKELLSFGDFEPVVSVEQETVSKPVPQKVLDDMRTCGAGIIHVKPEDRFLDETGTERRILNQNVLIEIGAAMALYGEHFILLVEDGATLPSNLQGLYEVRYAGDELGYDATMKVLKALNQFKTTQG